MINGETEEILGIFPGMIDNRKKFGGRAWTCKLIFTTRKLVATYEKRFGGRLKDPYYISFNAGARDRLKMKEISVENLLKENEENFEIPYSEIAAMEMKSPAFKNYRNLQVFSQEELSTPKYTFAVYISERYDDVFDEFLQKVVPDKV